MKHLKSFKEEIDLSQYDEVEPGRFVPKGTRYEDVNPVYYKLTPEQILDIVHSFSGATIPIEAIEEELQNYKNNKI
jgi:hypothetical protein